ncbi:putative Calcium/calmodulin-dependent protein kinase [metagenome]|uniref:Putative Calcium/calmodulin-dependent protein kinase n=1 Tax=metagenome TaxID=256318 RepID=A0A2P2C8F7_9ZZZZ
MRIPQVGDTFGPYEVRRVLGHGGMGVVFVATQVALDRPVALKVLLPQLAESADYRARFRREAAALASAQSPYIVPIFDYGEIEGSLFLATQLVPGGDLGLRIANAALDRATALEIARQVCTALGDAHDVGVLHRDVKPSNVLIWDRPEGPHSYLCDFGIAKVEGSLDTTTDGTAGTWAFLAPERCQGAPGSQASDIYAAGCLLWNLLTGNRPYAGLGVEVAQAHVHQPVPQLAVATPADDELNTILATAMAKDPADRYASAGEMARALARVIRAGDERTQTAPVPLVPVSAPAGAPRAGRWRIVAAVGAVAVLGAALVWAIGARDDPSQNPPASNEASGTRCWDGSSVASLDDCSEPFGAAGLAWAIPSLDLDDPRCVESEGVVEGKDVVVACEFQVRGARGLIRYSSWSSVEASAAHYRREFEQAARLVDRPGSAPRRVWRAEGRTPQGFYKMASAYVDWPFSVSVEGSTRAALEVGERSLRFRPRAEMTGIEAPG